MKSKPANERPINPRVLLLRVQDCSQLPLASLQRSPCVRGKAVPCCNLTFRVQGLLKHSKNACRQAKPDGIPSLGEHPAACRTHPAEAPTLRICRTADPADSSCWWSAGWLAGLLAGWPAGVGSGGVWPTVSVGREKGRGAAVSSLCTRPPQQQLWCKEQASLKEGGRQLQLPSLQLGNRCTLCSHPQMTICGVHTGQAGPCHAVDCP